MAELNIGKHCSFPACKQLDFLPIRCNGCELIFCKDHHAYDQHQCTLEKCKPLNQEFSGTKGYTCSLQDCDQRELTEVVCEGCGKSFCLQHRHQVDHQCPTYQEPVAKMLNTKEHVEKILASKSDGPSAKSSSKPRSKKPLSKKAKATAAKVALMKIKMKAVGEKSIPEAERVYFAVGLPLGSKDKTKAICVSKKWSVGRVVDKISSTFGVENRNNVPGKKKLCMFDAADGKKLSPEKSIETLMQEEESDIYSGSCVILEYVDGDTQELTDLDVYQL